MNLLNVGGSLTGGSTVVLHPAGVSAGGTSYVTAAHTRQKQELIQFSQSANGSQQAPVARTGLKITLADREVAEGCCTVTEGSIIADLGIRWNLNQSVTQAQRMLDLLRATVSSTQFGEAFLKGLLPTG